MPWQPAQPIAFDEGEWFGAPAYVVSCMPGRAELYNLDYEQIAETILAISSYPTTRLPAPLQRKEIDITTWAPPPGLRKSPLVDKAVETVLARIPDAAREEKVLSHNDFHPDNMLWLRGRMTGLIDWMSAGLHYRTREVGAQGRTDLTDERAVRRARRVVERAVHAL